MSLPSAGKPFAFPLFPPSPRFRLPCLLVVVKTLWRFFNSPPLFPIIPPFRNTGVTTSFSRERLDFFFLGEVWKCDGSFLKSEVLINQPSGVSLRRDTAVSPFLSLRSVARAITMSARSPWILKLAPASVRVPYAPWLYAKMYARSFFVTVSRKLLFSCPPLYRHRNLSVRMLTPPPPSLQISFPLLRLPREEGILFLSIYIFSFFLGC